MLFRSFIESVFSKSSVNTRKLISKDFCFGLYRISVMLVWKACVFRRREDGEGRKEVCKIKTIPKTKNLQEFFKLAGFIDFVFLFKKNIEFRCENIGLQFT